MTVSMYLASNGIIPPKEWYHNPELRNNKGETVEDILTQKNIEVPKEWKIYHPP